MVFSRRYAKGLRELQGAQSNGPEHLVNAEFTTLPSPGVSRAGLVSGDRARGSNKVVDRVLQTLLGCAEKIHTCQVIAINFVSLEHLF